MPDKEQKTAFDKYLRIDPFTYTGAGLSGKYAAYEQYLSDKKYFDGLKAFKGAGIAVAALPDAIQATGALLEGNYDKAMGHVSSGIGSWAGAWAGAKGGAAIGSLFGPAGAVIGAGVGGFGGAILGSKAGEIIYDHVGTALRWTGNAIYSGITYTGNAIEGGIRDYTLGTLSPAAQSFALSASSYADPAAKWLSGGLQQIAQDHNESLQSGVQWASDGLQVGTQKLSGFLGDLTKSGGELLNRLFNGSPSSEPSSPDTISPAWEAAFSNGGYFLDSPVLASAPLRAPEYLLDLTYAPSSPPPSPRRARAVSSPAAVLPANEYAPPPEARVPHPHELAERAEADFAAETIPEVSPYWYTTEPSYYDAMSSMLAGQGYQMRAHDDALSGIDWESGLEQMQRLESPAYYDDALGSLDWEAADAQARRLDYLTAVSKAKQQYAVVGTAMDSAQSMVSAIQGISDLVSGKKSDIGTYVNVLNSGVSAARGIAGIMDPGQTPVLDQLGDYAGGIAGGFGLYNTIAGLAEGRLDARSLIAAPGQIASVANMLGVGGLESLGSFRFQYN